MGLLEKIIIEFQTLIKECFYFLESEYALEKQFVVYLVVVLWILRILLRSLLKLGNCIEYQTDVFHALDPHSLSLPQLKHFVHFLQFLADYLIMAVLCII